MRDVFRIWLFVFFCAPILAQDSLQLELKELGIEDINRQTSISDDRKMISGGRFIRDRDQMPYTAFVITKEEILDNGFITLVDVLKWLPGIRVSQPGSAQEGETFMLRGLLGNSHMKILLNGNPVKPSAVRGMPIGAQLPIRQAERIEVFYGPSAVRYGADASLGVINIITKESERPVYVQADLSVGSNGFSSLDILFGGKLGKNKNVLQYMVYGSNTIMNDRSIVYEEETLYNPITYIPQTGMPGTNADTMFVNDPNYSGTAASPDFSFLPHLSRVLGTQLKYRIFNFSARILYRQDHSSIGLNPYAISYADPENYFGETMVNVNMGVEKNFKKWGFSSKLNYIRYEVDPLSSHTYVKERLDRAISRMTDIIQVQAVRDSVRQALEGVYFTGERYSYALSNDIRLEQTFFWTPTPNLNITAGGDVNAALGWAQAYFLSDPFDNTGISLNKAPLDVPLAPESFTFGDWGLFTQAEFEWNKLRGVVGYRYYRHPFYGSAHNPQGAFSYSLNDNLNLRASFGSAFRVPPAFYRANTYVLSPSNLANISTLNQDLVPERTQGFDFGLRWRKDEVFRTDISFFYTLTTNFISYNFDDTDEIDDGVLEFVIGYFNDSDSRATLYGIQTNSEYIIRAPLFTLNNELNLNFNIGKETLPQGKGTLDVVRGQPSFLGQLNQSLTFWKGTAYLNITHIYSSGFVKTNISNSQQYNNNPEFFTNDGFYTMDILGRYRVSKNFQGYISIKNVLNKKYAGIDATGTIDDLVYNPQSLRTITFGLSYRIE